MLHQKDIRFYVKTQDGLVFWPTKTVETKEIDINNEVPAKLYDLYYDYCFFYLKNDEKFKPMMETIAAQIVAQGYKPPTAVKKVFLLDNPKKEIVYYIDGTPFFL